MLGDVQLAREFSRQLFDEGLFAMALGFPTVPLGKARIRVMISAAHSQDHLEQALDAFDTVGKRLGKSA
jgi:glycine C-acetyltransferase